MHELYEKVVVVVVVVVVFLFCFVLFFLSVGYVKTIRRHALGFSRSLPSN